MYLGKYNKYKLINFLLCTYKDTLYDNIFKHKEKLISIILKLNDKDFYNCIIYLNRKSYIGYYALNISNNLNKFIEDKNYNKVQKILKNSYIEEIFDNHLLSEDYKNMIRRLIVMEKIAYNMLLEKCTLDYNIQINHCELNICREEINKSEIESNYFEKHKTKIVLTKYGREDIYDINDLIYRCYKNINDFNGETIDIKTRRFIKNKYKNESLIIQNYILKKTN